MIASTVRAYVACNIEQHALIPPFLKHTILDTTSCIYKLQSFFADNVTDEAVRVNATSCHMSHLWR